MTSSPLDIPTTHWQAPELVARARCVCARCGLPVIEQAPLANLSPHVCRGDYEWLSDAS